MPYVSASVEAGNIYHVNAIVKFSHPLYINYCILVIFKNQELVTLLSKQNTLIVCWQIPHPKCLKIVVDAYIHFRRWVVSRCTPHQFHRRVNVM